jgi:hypothetical protein
MGELGVGAKNIDWAAPLDEFAWRGQRKRTGAVGSNVHTLWASVLEVSSCGTYMVAA